MFILHVYQFNLMMETVFVVLIAREDEVQNADSIDIVKMKIPVGADFALFDNRESGLEHAAVFEKVLAGFLHFSDELLAVLPSSCRFRIMAQS